MAYDLLEESRTSMEQIMAEMLSIKKEGKPKSHLTELVTQMSLHFVNLRQANRSILLEEDRVKAETEEAKAPVELTTLQLQNLTYEKNHYVKAIKTSKDFISKYPDIELVSQEEFFSDAPEEIKRKAMATDSTRDLTLKRLNFELYQRKELCKLHEKLEQQKKDLLETISNRKKFLSSLPTHLKALKKASLPVQQRLGVIKSEKLKQQNSGELLPPPLYVIYSQFLSQKKAFGENIDIEILGSMIDAQSFAHQQASRDTGISKITEKTRLEEDVADEDDEDRRSRKRRKTVSGKENQDHAGIYQSHPLRVILHIYDNEDSDPNPTKLVSLFFEYLLKLNVVCVGLEGSSSEEPETNILSDLFPDDTGTNFPHQSAKLVAGSAAAFYGNRTSRPYKWAQHLGGIYFLPEVSPLLITDKSQNSGGISASVSSRQQNQIQTVLLQKVRSRKKSQLALA